MRQFLYLCGAPMKNTFLQYLSKNGGARHVSKKEGSVGEELRNILRKAKEAVESGVDLAAARPLTPVWTQRALEDAYEFTQEELYKLGVTHVEVSQDGSQLEISLSDSSTTSCDEVVQILEENSVLKVPKPAVNVTTYANIHSQMDLTPLVFAQIDGVLPRVRRKWVI